MLSPKTKNHISRIIPFGLIWLMASALYSLLERGLLGNLGTYPATGNPYNFASNIFIIPLTALLTGLLIGTFEVLVLHKLFIQKSFTQKIVYKTLIYLAIIVFFLLSLAVFGNAYELQATVFDKQVWDNTRAFFLNFAFWSVEIYIAAMISISLFYNEVSENLGHAVLNNFLTGKYHTPIEEERIFLFLDIRSSTTIAERIGHVKYFQMLKAYFADLTDPIITYSGEIYQYVGDEIVVSWKLKNGLHNNNCIRCFFAMKKEIEKQAKKYIETFGLVPEFKAGFHIGKVTAGEIGIIKKDIIFTGDVLNTTARIQGLCNTYNVDILISGHLRERLHFGQQFELKALGESELRGRDEKITLFTVLAVT
jgi:adenylate cyclase